MKKLILVFILSLTITSSCTSIEDTFPSPKKLDTNGFEGTFVEAGRLYISGQPNEEAFSRLKYLGVTTVINLRTPTEMENKTSIPFDEKEVVNKHGMDYVHIPLGGPDFPYNKEALVKFAEAFDNTNGKVLVHCAGGYRAAHMWAAYLIEYKKYSPEEAVEYARPANFGELPIEGLLGKKAIFKFE